MASSPGRTSPASHTGTASPAAGGSVLSGPQRVAAPAKLTCSLRVLGRRADGLHLLRAEMASVSLADELVLWPGEAGVAVVDPDGQPVRGVPVGLDNLVDRALRLAGRRARVEVHKRIPVGGGLGGGSADAAAVLRWAGWHGDPAAVVALGSDVPFCTVGGRAVVEGVGEHVQPLPFEARRYLLLLPPLRVDTAAVYRAWDQLLPARQVDPAEDFPNDLTAAALEVAPALVGWRNALATATGARPVLAGSGSTWFVPDATVPAAPAVVTDRSGRTFLVVGDQRAPLLVVQAVPADWVPPAGG